MGYCLVMGAAAGILDFRPLLCLDFLINTASCGRNPNIKADAFAPTVPKSPPRFHLNVDFPSSKEKGQQEHNDWLRHSVINHKR
ncbi:hypothetical protein D3C75_1121170 [compost metagenome]